MSLGGGDLQVILRRIRHGFIVSDDSELCDKIISQDIENDQRRRNLAISKATNIEKADLLTLLRTEPDFILDELSHSPEWTITNVQVRRVRCETLDRLDEIKNENEAKRKVKIISWHDPSQVRKDTNESMNLSEGISDCLGSPLIVPVEAPKPLPAQPSPLTTLIRSTSHTLNPFSSYARFDGTINTGSNQSKRFTVHFQAQKQQLPIAVSSNATVTEAIGFICYKYTSENREPILTQQDPSKYSLLIADDDGSPEEFPPLMHERSFGQYDFPHFVLIEQITQRKVSASSVRHTHEMHPLGTDDDDDDDDGDGSCDDSSRSVTPPIAEHQKPSASVGKTSETVLIEEIPDAVDPINNWNRLFDSLNQKSYFFDYYVKLGSSKHVKARVDVSGEQVRIDLLEKTSRLPWNNLVLSTQRLVDCTLLSKDKNKKRERARVHLVLEIQQESNGSYTFQTHELESTIEIIEQFRDQILNIIQLKNSKGHDKYESQQHQRENTKKRRSILNIFGSGTS